MIAWAVFYTLEDLIDRISLIMSYVYVYFHIYIYIYIYIDR